MSEEITELHHSIAEANGFKVYATYKEAEAAKFLGLSLSTLSRIRSRDEVGFIQKSKRRVEYFGFHLVDYLLAQQRCPNTQLQTDVSKLVTIGSANEKLDQAHGFELGLTPSPDRPSASALAQRTMKNASSY